MMDFDEWQREWLKVADMRGHRFIKRDGKIDMYAGASNGNHNGPKCERCTWGPCMHCSHDFDSIPDCERYAAENKVTPPKFRPGDIVLYGAAKERARIKKIEHVASEHAHPSIYRIELWSTSGYWSNKSFNADEGVLVGTGERA